MLPHVVKPDISRLRDTNYIHRFASGHRAEIERSEKCACFHCEAVFDPSEIVEGGDEFGQHPDESFWDADTDRRAPAQSPTLLAPEDQVITPRVEPQLHGRTATLGSAECQQRAALAKRQALGP